MPLYVEPGLPAVETLRAEGFTLFPLADAPTGVIRVGVLNLMPLKIQTETELLRMMSGTCRDVMVEFVELQSHRGTHTTEEHMDRFYQRFTEVRDRVFDGFVITGAPVEKMDFDQVTYWPELTAIMDWTHDHVRGSVLYICWAALAGLHYHHGISKQVLDRKISGVFRHKAVDDAYGLFAGLGKDGFYVPHSRFGTVKYEDIAVCGNLEIMAVGDGCGVYAMATRGRREFFVTGHPEYDCMTLDGEYRRDLGRGLSPYIPDNYYPENDPSRFPEGLWKRDSMMFFSNWIDLCLQRK